MQTHYALVPAWALGLAIRLPQVSSSTSGPPTHFQYKQAIQVRRKGIDGLRGDSRPAVHMSPARNVMECLGKRRIHASTSEYRDDSRTFLGMSVDRPQRVHKTSW